MKFIALLLLPSLLSPLFADNAKEISDRHMAAMLQELKTYIAGNPEAADLNEAYELGVQAAYMTDDTAEVVALLKMQFKGLTAQPGASEEQVIQTGMMLAQFSLQEGDGAPAREVKEVFDELAAANPDSSYGQVTAALRGMLETPQMGGVPELSGTTLDGKDISLEDYRGKVVLLDFWATWCGPCVEEIPNVKAVYDTYRDQGFEIIGISLDRSIDPLKEFIADKGLEWPTIFDADQKASLADQFGITSIPTLYLVDRDGKIAAMNPRGAALEPAVAKLLKGE